MSGMLDWLNGFFLKVEGWLSWIWQELAAAEREHPVILAIAVLLVVIWVLSICCGCCCRSKRPYYVLVGQQPAPCYGAVQNNKKPRRSF